MEPKFIKKDIERIARLTASNVAFFTSIGLIKKEAPGRGRARKYSRQDLLEFLLIKSLNSRGLTHGKIDFILDYLRHHPHKPLVHRSEYYTSSRGYLIFSTDPATGKEYIDFRHMFGEKACVLSESEIKEKYKDPVIIDFGELARIADTA